ncbi:methyltransferase domain-containing protein [Paenibacillus sp. LMG 31461]|uniref:Methyltransferase domain-containing protein n=1 Tax=Paenibacillus plantarum TaxID=2654975 RepID=A0ABX1XFN0_9BACL|nr:class I SAM-dependent methyltransferase [Paenibacillus plantarum]NOU66739.1 methyltransferase domain-containing protein [Paenibacillus plantarum]
MSVDRINEYANSMFINEKLHEKWIQSCADYIVEICGELIQDKVVIDYAFGRGNWSLAFLRAGAKRVISVDASSDNVRRFNDYCINLNIKNIEIIHGNILEEELNLQADFIWLYGILPCIKEFDTFIGKIKQCLMNEDAFIYVYSYNAKSLREFTVDTCRNVLIYENYKEFTDDSDLFIRHARLRARDDLTAPHVRWDTSETLINDLNKNGLYAVRQDKDFYEYLTGVYNEEFYPYQYLCKVNPPNKIETIENSNSYVQEINLLYQLADQVFSYSYSESERKKIAIGLFNTHFAYLDDNKSINKCIIELFLYLMQIVFRMGNKYEVKGSSNITMYIELFKLSVSGSPRSDYYDLISNNIISKYLIENTVRI